MHTEEGAAEVTQQTFVRAYESLDAWRGTELAPWLTAIATHTALKLLDKERRRHSTSLDSLPVSVLGSFPAETSPSTPRNTKPSSNRWKPPSLSCPNKTNISCVSTTTNNVAQPTSPARQDSHRAMSL